MLEPIGHASVDQLWELHQDPGIAEWNAGAWSRADAERFAARMETAWRVDGVGKWLAHRRDDGELVGRGGATRAVVDGISCVEIGWAVRQSLWGCGYATEIGAATLRFVAQLPDAEPVVAFTEVHNARSRAVMERLGMVYASEIRCPGLVSGLSGVHDDAPFALYRASTPSRRAAVTQEGNSVSRRS